MTEFRGFPKIPRLNRECIITEKIDGTNSCIVIDGHTEEFWVKAQSRSQFITPAQDNHGFAKWVYANATTLVRDLGPGYHYGEWWGSGIQRGYGLKKGEKRFSLFNTHRWQDAQFATPNMSTTPVLYQGLFTTTAVNDAIEMLKREGSVAAPGYTNPEGVIVFHREANQMFKVTVNNDGWPKSMVQQ